MVLLRKASVNEQARAKVGAFGEQGSGKTTTLAIMAIAVSKLFHNGAPVAMFDTENGSDFVAPLFQAEGIEFYVTKSGAFADVVPSLREAEQAGCCAFITDSATHIWNELVASYCAKKAQEYNKKSYTPNWLTDARPIKEAWSVWTKAFLNSKLHCFIAGRAGLTWEKVPDENGKLETTPTGTRMKTEGEFGYEPNLLLEMEAVRIETTQRKRGGRFVHKVHVLKDRARFLNGKTFEFPDINNYKVGDWKKIFTPFEPHFAFLNIGGTQRALESSTSQDLFDGNGQTEYIRRGREKQIALDETLATMQLLWPGQSAADKQLRIRVMETIWGARAWSSIEAMPLEQVQDGLDLLRSYEAHSKQPPCDTADLPRSLGLETEAGVLALLNAVKAERNGYSQQKGPAPTYDGNGATAPSRTELAAQIVTSNGDGTLHIRKETPVNLPPIPQSQHLEGDDLEIFYEPTANSTIRLTGDTVHIHKTLKQIFKAKGTKTGPNDYSWDMPMAHFDGLQGLCQKVGIRLVAADSGRAA